MPDITLEEAVEQLIKARDEWEEACMRRGAEQARQEDRKKQAYRAMIAPSGLAFLLDDDTISDPRD